MDFGQKSKPILCEHEINTVVGSNELGTCPDADKLLEKQFVSCLSLVFVINHRRPAYTMLRVLEDARTTQEDSPDSGIR